MMKPSQDAPIEDVRRSGPATRDLPGQGRLADLTRPEEGDDGNAGQEALEGPAVPVTGDHSGHDTTKIGRHASNFHTKGRDETGEEHGRARDAGAVLSLS